MELTGVKFTKLRIGRNDSCPCGSGKKYKKCHLNPIELVPTGELLEGRPIISTEFQGFRVVAVGSRLYPRFPINGTFHDFLIVFLKDILEPTWGMAEQQKPKEEQHIIVKWLSEMGELLRNSQARMEIPEKDIKSAETTGNVQSLLALAYDIYSIYHCAKLPDELVARLKNDDQFQGAKYEIAVAGIFARAGFKIEWIPKSSDKICEFIATDPKTSNQVIVEAKSRHRQGVLNTPGNVRELNLMKAEVTQLYNKALNKNTQNLPFMIFIDVNFPLTPGDNSLEKKWVEDIKKMLDRYPLNTSVNPSKYNVLFVTNFSWHYQAKQRNHGRQESVTIIPLHPEKNLNNDLLIGQLLSAVEQYGEVPPLFPEDMNKTKKD